MGSKNRGIVVVRFGDGSIINAWESVELRDSFLDPLGEISLVARPPRDRLDFYNQRLKKGELISVLINDIPQGVQLIQTVQKTIGRHGVEIKVTANTPLVTAVEASANPDLTFHSEGDTEIIDIIGKIFQPFGFENVFSSSEDLANVKSGKLIVKGKETLKIKALKTKDLQAHEGETAYGLATRLCNNVGLALRCDIYGNLTLSRPRYDQPAAYTVVQDFDGHLLGDRLIDGIEIIDTNADVFSECVVRGSQVDTDEQTFAARPQARYILESAKKASDAQSPPPAFSKLSTTTFADSRHTYRAAASAAPYKPKIVRDKMSRDLNTCLSVAKLIIGLRASKAYVVTCEVDGWISQTGRVWTTDTICRVTILADGLDEDMWILERTLILDRSGGQRTRLRLIPKESLLLGDVPQ